MNFASRTKWHYTAITKDGKKTVGRIHPGKTAEQCATALMIYNPSITLVFAWRWKEPMFYLRSTDEG